MFLGVEVLRSIVFFIGILQIEKFNVFLMILRVVFFEKWDSVRFYRDHRLMTYLPNLERLFSVVGQFR